MEELHHDTSPDRHGVDRPPEHQVRAVGNLATRSFLPDLPVELRQSSEDANLFQYRRGVQAYIQRMSPIWAERGIEVNPDFR